LIKHLDEVNYLGRKEVYKIKLIDDTIYRNTHDKELRNDFYAITFISYVYLDDPREL
jgi:hypothetical protein